jgi:hypothetical protein
MRQRPFVPVFLILSLATGAAASAAEVAPKPDAGATVADSRGPAITFLAPADETSAALPPEAGKHRTEELRARNSRLPV